jgi:hypothetical protein
MGNNDKGATLPNPTRPNTPTAPPAVEPRNPAPMPSPDKQREAYERQHEHDTKPIK